MKYLPSDLPYKAYLILNYYSIFEIEGCMNQYHYKM